MSFVNNSTTLVGTTAAETMNVTKITAKKDPMENIDPNFAPLEQNVKNMYCDGTKYKVVKEDPTLLKPFEINRFSISPSRNAQKRMMDKQNAKYQTKQQKVAAKRKSMKPGDDSCFALLAGENAANEEIFAE